jgi:hypothetical protein
MYRRVYMVRKHTKTLLKTEQFLWCDKEKLRQNTSKGKNAHRLPCEVYSAGSTVSCWNRSNEPSRRCQLRRECELWLQSQDGQSDPVRVSSWHGPGDFRATKTNCSISTISFLGQFWKATRWHVILSHRIYRNYPADLNITFKNITRRETKLLQPISFFRKCNNNNNEIYTDYLYIFAILWLFIHKVFVIFNTLLPSLSKTLCTSAVKFPASTSEHITSGARKL